MGEETIEGAEMKRNVVKRMQIIESKLPALMKLVVNFTARNF